MSIPERPGSRRPWQTDREWARLSARIAAVDTSPAPTPFSWRPIVSIAAGIATVAASAVYAVRHRANTVAHPQIVSTTAGQRIVVRLGDSSTITLGPSTTARITTSQAARVVDLDGMADFRVTHDSTRPFIVRAKDTQTTDLGTEFTVRAYASDSSVNVAVTSASCRSRPARRQPPRSRFMRATSVSRRQDMRRSGRQSTRERSRAGWTAVCPSRTSRCAV